MENQLKRKVEEIIKGLKYNIIYETFYSDIKLYIYREDYFGNTPIRTKIKGITKINDELFGCSLDINMSEIRTIEEFKFSIEFSIKELVKNFTNIKYDVRL